MDNMEELYTQNLKDIAALPNLWYFESGFVRLLSRSRQNTDFGGRRSLHEPKGTGREENDQECFHVRQIRPFDGSLVLHVKS